MRLPISRPKQSSRFQPVLLSAAILLGLCVQGGKGVSRTLNAEDIARNLVGKQVLVSHEDGIAWARLEPTGVARASGGFYGSDWTAQGHWIVFDGALCLYLVGGPDLRNLCAALTPTGPGAFVTEFGTRLTVMEPRS